MKLATVVLLATVAALTAGVPAPSSPGEDARYLLAHRAAVRQRARADDLQRRLSVRVRQVRRLERRLAAARPDSPAGVVAELARGFQCIHGYEGSWTDTGAPFWGGLQMDSQFMASYAPAELRAKGTADRWSPVEQLAVGILGWSLRGRTFSPWPNTARWCGLL